MKNFGKVFIGFVIMGLIGSFTACQKKSATTTEIQAGAKVAAVWGTDSWYTATVSTVKGNQYDVAYDDGTTGTVDAAGIKILPTDPQIGVGDSVMAAWQGGAKLYSGVVTEIQGDDYIVKWDDGSEPSPIAKGKILKK